MEKRRIVLILWAILNSLYISSQEIKVKNMELLPSDITARTNPRLDGNDEPCALIKVIIPTVEGLQFEGWVIGNVQYRPGEYQVYVPAGTKKIIFRHPDYAPGEIRFTIPIEGKCTYRVTLEAPQRVGGLESVEQGDAAAMLKQAQNYERGSGSYQKDISQALIWYEKAAEAGSIEAQEYLAEVLYKGTKGFRKDENKALQWNEICAKRGKAECYMPLVELYSTMKQQEQAITWLKKHCELKKNDISQIVRLGKLIGVDKQEGFKWLQIASESGNKEATSLCLQQMKKKSPKDAIPFYQRAIDEGDMVAANEYAQILMEGKYGVPRDEVEAKRLLDLAASAVFNTYTNYQSDDPDFQTYINNIPELISRAKNRDVKAMISLVLIYRALDDKEMMERMLTVVRYNISNGLKLPSTFDFYLEMKANYKETDYEKLLYEGFDFSAISKTDYFKFMRQVIDNIILAPTPSFQFTSNYSVHYQWNTPRDEVTKLLVRWAKIYYDKDCLILLENPLILKVLPIEVAYKDYRKNNFRYFDISNYDGTLRGYNEYEHRVIMAIYNHARQNWKLGSYPYYDNYKWAYKQLERYAEQAQKKEPTFSDATRYTSWLRKLKEDGYFWALGSGMGSKADIIEKRGKQFGAIIFEVNGVKFNMIPVKEGGTYNGDGKTKQMNHSFFVSETEVTNELWNTVMGVQSAVRPNHPASATWEEWAQFLNKLGQLTGKKFRALTQGEWAYAAQGGLESKGYRYSGSNNIDDVAWYDGNAKETQEVAQKKPNELGIYDMSGNAIEYTENPAVFNAAGGGLCQGLNWWPTKEGCTIRPFSPKYRCNPNIKLGFRLALTTK